MSLMLVADNTSESDKIVACSLKTLMIKITLQFRKHNAMIATEFFFLGGGGGGGQPWFTSLTWSNTSHLRKVQSKNLGKEVYYFKRYLPVSFCGGVVVLPGLYLLQLADMSVATTEI